MCPTPSLFGESERPRKVKPVKLNPLAPWFDAFIALLGEVVVSNARGRVGKIASAMLAAGLTPAHVSQIPTVVHRWAPHRRVLDVGTCQQCWPWIVNPPPQVGRSSPLTLAATAAHANGGELPF